MTDSLEVPDYRNTCLILDALDQVLATAWYDDVDPLSHRRQQEAYRLPVRSRHHLDGVTGQTSDLQS